jgi:hypothetical protein
VTGFCFFSSKTVLHLFEPIGMLLVVYFSEQNSRIKRAKLLKPDKQFFNQQSIVRSCIMSSAIFSNGNQAYQVAKIIYAGPVSQIPEERRRNGSTHSFKIITGLGTVFSYYKNEEMARKSRGMLAGMLSSLKPAAFKHGYVFIDPAQVVSFGSVVQFKKPVEEYTHGFVISVETAEAKSQEVWLRYRSEDHAQKGRKALWASVHSANGMSKSAAAQPAASAMPF